MDDALRKQLEESGASNVEVDWFLRGKLPTNNTPISTIHSPSPITDDHNIHNIGNSTIRRQSDSEIHALSRTRSLPVRSSEEPKKKGFFKSLFNKKGSSKQPSRAPSPPEIHTNSSSSSSLERSTSPKHSPFQRSRSLSVYADSSNIDPKLEEFLKYYKSKGLAKIHKNIEEEEQSKINKTDPSLSLSSSDTPSPLSSTTKLKPTKVDALGRPIPSHPAIAPLPPAIIKKSNFERELPPSVQQSQASSKLKFLRLHHTITSDQSLSRTNSIISTPTSTEAESDEVVIPGLDGLPKLKRVAFDIPVFFNDPPQQIPSRSPRKGEVEIMKDGSIVIHKLTAAEKRQMLKNTGGGLVVGGSGSLKVIANHQEPTQQDSVQNPQDEEEKKRIQDQHDSQKHSIEVAAAEVAAEARAKEAPNELKRVVTNNEDEVVVNSDAQKINIDKPMVRHNKSTASLVSLAHNIDEGGSLPPKDVKVPLDILYTRCCHLREILPIPAIQKQIKAGSTDPISTLQLRNPKPSLIEVLTFSDFVSVAPILCVSLDGVSLSSDMFRIILSSLLCKKELEKLTLRNTPIDEYGWKLLCWFLTKNKTLSRLDLTQVPPLVTNVQKPAKASTLNVARMECDMSSRADMNWSLFNAALITRKGIDELVLNGAKMSNQQFKDLIELGVSIKTTKLGLAYNELSADQCQVLAENLNFKTVIGIDLGYNDLSHGKLSYFIDGTGKANLEGSHLKFISLNSANLDNKEEVDKFVNNFSSLRELRYIDLSNNKKLFPESMVSLSQSLPLYPNLLRIHLDYNDLSQEAIVALAEFLPFCKSLNYVSLVGNTIDNVSAGALASALKLSKSIIKLDINYEEVSPRIKESIALYTVRNMQNLQNQVYGKQTDPKELSGLQEELSQLLLDNETTLKPKLVESFVQKAMKLRKRIHESIDELFQLRIQGKLNTEGKETLIRFCFIDSSIEKGLNLLQQKTPLSFQNTPLSPPYYLDAPNYPNSDSKSDIISPLSMSRQSSTNLIVSPYITENNHAELMPFGNSNTGVDQDIHADAQEIKDDTRARDADSKKIREEASALKIGSMIRDSDLVKSLSKEHINTLQDISGDRFREILLKTSDLNNVVDVLDSLKQKGIPIGDIYKKTANPEKKQHGEILDLETLKNTQTNFNRTHTHISKDGDNNIQTDSESDSESSDDSSDEDQLEDGINHAYDEILDHLEKVRTNT